MATVSSSPPLYRPKPHRPFRHSAIPQPPSPLLTPADFDETPSRTHSILNLTSSTLGGIYSPAGFQADDQPSTPWGPGTQTPQTESFPPEQYTRPPLRRQSSMPPQSPRTAPATVFALALRSMLLFGMGMGYGLLVRHLHDDRQLAPFQVEGLIKPGNDWRYLLFWGISGVAIGSLMPWVDTLFEAAESDVPVGTRDEAKTGAGETEAMQRSEGILGADWTPVVRSVGAFVGIAYAIRKLPWASTLQASLTLALVNPVLWYLIDRSKPGFILSSAVGATGTALLLASNPDMMPSPASATSSRAANASIDPHSLIPDSTSIGLGFLTRERVEGGIWILSVLFCSCVCFGNIGRRLSLGGMGRKRLAATGVHGQASRRRFS